MHSGLTLQDYLIIKTSKRESSSQPTTKRNIAATESVIQPYSTTRSLSKMDLQVMVVTAKIRWSLKYLAVPYLLGLFACCALSFT